MQTAENASSLYAVAVLQQYHGSDAEYIGQLGDVLLDAPRAKGATIVDKWPHGLTDPEIVGVPFRRYALSREDGREIGELTLTAYSRVQNGERRLWISVQALGVRIDR
jgi:hypothetical protein